MRLNGTFSSENIDCFSQRTRCFRRNRFYYADMHKQISTKPNAVSHYIVDLHLGWVSSTFATNGRIFRPSRIDFSSYVSMSTYVLLATVTNSKSYRDFLCMCRTFKMYIPSCEHCGDLLEIADWMPPT